jgi:hypothetical protein
VTDLRGFVLVGKRCCAGTPNLIAPLERVLGKVGGHPLFEALKQDRPVKGLGSP